MKYSTKAERFFTEDERKRIEDATHEVEKKTSGEVAVMVVESSDPYPETEVTGGVIVSGIISFGITLFFFHASLWYYIPISFILFFPFSFLFRKMPVLKRAFINIRLREDAVRLRALRAFYEKGLYRTRDNTGVLFFLSLLERKVWVLADRGIYEKIHQDTLNTFAMAVSHGIREDRACETLCNAIRDMGELLALHFPKRTDDTDELSNKIITG